MTKLSKKSWHCKFYKTTFDTNTPPNDLCSYFWALVLSVVSLPFTWIIYIINFFSKTNCSYGTKLGCGILIEIISTAVILLIIVITRMFIHYTLPTCIATGIIGIYIHKKRVVTFISDNLGEVGSIVYEGVKSVKNKYCAVIVWESEKK